MGNQNQDNSGQIDSGNQNFSNSGQSELGQFGAVGIRAVGIGAIWGSQNQTVQGNHNQGFGSNQIQGSRNPGNSTDTISRDTHCFKLATLHQSCFWLYSLTT